MPNRRINKLAPRLSRFDSLKGLVSALLTILELPAPVSPRRQPTHTVACIEALAAAVCGQQSLCSGAIARSFNCLRGRQRGYCLKVCPFSVSIPRRVCTCSSGVDVFPPTPSRPALPDTSAIQPSSLGGTLFKPISHHTGGLPFREHRDGGV